MGLNLTESVTPGLGDHAGGESSVTAGSDMQITILVVMTSFALLGVVYSAALIAFNCFKSKDRTIKLTSPNINIMTCLGCLLALLSIPLLGIERPIISDLASISNIQQAGMFTASAGATIIYSSILVKTWRVHRIFKKMQLSSKVTKDEHLILMIVGLTLIDAAVNIAWLKVDHITCADSPTATSQQTGKLICSSKYQPVWSTVLTVYKLLITAATLFYAWHVRHVKLPSLQDSRFIVTNSLIVVTVLMTSLPAVSSPETINTTRYSSLSLAVIGMVFSTLSLLLAPKIFLLRKKDNSKSTSAVRFLFGESLKKQKEKEEPPAGCWAGFKSCNSPAGSSMGDSVLAQEIETLKQLLKEKDDTIRELTDRLFFGADKFKAYVNDKTSNSRRSANTAVCDTNREEIYRHQRSRSRQSRLEQKPQCSPVSSIDSGNIDDLYSTRSQSRGQPNYYTIDSTTANKYTTQNNTSHTLPPIKELSVTDLTNHNVATEQLRSNQSYSTVERSTTPTTDSAINMSRSASSSEDESYHERRSPSSPSIHEMADRVRALMLQPSDGHISESNSSEHTLKSTSTVITSATLSPSTEQFPILPNSKRQTITSNKHSDSLVGHRRSKPPSAIQANIKRLPAVSSHRPVTADKRLPAVSSHRPVTADSGSLRQSSRSNTSHQHLSSAPAADRYGNSSAYQQLSDSVVGDEVELEIMFPVAESV